MSCSFPSTGLLCLWLDLFLGVLQAGASPLVGGARSQSGWLHGPELGRAGAWCWPIGGEGWVPEQLAVWPGVSGNWCQPAGGQVIPWS